MPRHDSTSIPLETQKRLSVVIPCYNLENYIQECLSSLEQFATVIEEIVVVDNKSSDLSVEVVQAFSEHSKNKIRLAFEPQRGANHARNHGLALVSTEYVHFLDGDDMIIGEYFIPKSKASVFLFGFEKADFNQNITSHLPTRDFQWGLFTTKLGQTSSMIFRTEKLKEIEGFDARWTSSQEYELLFRLFRSKQAFTVVNKYLVRIRQRSHGQISQSNIDRNWQNYARLRLEMIQEWQNPILPKYADYLLWILKNQARWYPKVSQTQLKSVRSRLVIPSIQRKTDRLIVRSKGWLFYYYLVKNRFT